MPYYQLAKLVCFLALVFTLVLGCNAGSIPFVNAVPTAPDCTAVNGTWSIEHRYLYSGSFNVSNCIISEFVLTKSYSGGGRGYFVDGKYMLPLFTSVPIKNDLFSAEETHGKGTVSISGKFTSSTEVEITWKATSGVEYQGISFTQDEIVKSTASPKQ